MLLSLYNSSRISVPLFSENLTFFTGHIMHISTPILCMFYALNEIGILYQIFFS